MTIIHFINPDKKIDAEPGESVLDAALRCGVSLYHTCGGNASCSTCRVIIRSGGEDLSPPDELETQVLDSFDLRAPFRLSCQSIVGKKDMEIEIPDRDKAPRPNKTPKIRD